MIWYYVNVVDENRYLKYQNLNKNKKRKGDFYEGIKYNNTTYRRRKNDRNI